MTNNMRELEQSDMTPLPHKQFAQHWLRSEKVLNKIVTAAALHKRDRILEIGSGTGVLTSRLLWESEAVVAVEIDRDLCQKLAQRIAREDNCLLLQDDILSLDLNTQFAASETRFQNPNKVIANIPYNITGPILEKILGTIAQPAAAYELIVLLVQKEIAERLCTPPGSKTFGALSVRVQYLAECEFISAVPAKAFFPPPKVDSAIVRLRPRAFELAAEDPKLLESIVKMGFSNKRKMLRNNLKGVIESNKITQLLEQLEINPQARAEDLNVRDWVVLSNKLA